MFLSVTLLLAYGKNYNVKALQANNKVSYSLCNEENKNVMDVSYINVGQGDSELIQVNGKNILIDAGPRKSSKAVIEYLKSRNITTLDYVVATHPHEDHIGATK
ncbi:MBL fold metallo-hydrolase [Clostridium tarantellae]|uniref:MBL fold metallo-hydrolase n=1 Tax=Clostridium tarantellae TaxID=39493 RepID=A0A6I1MNG5_9CLOT|nr:MBL fold metallo-hydrolase [Clostridium tarantellae]